MGQATEGKRLARLDGELPEADFAELLQQLFGEVRFPHRDAAGGDEGVGLAIGLQKGGAQLGRIVWDDAKVEAVAAHAIQHGPHTVAVGVVDVAVGEGGADRLELVTGTEDGHYERPTYRHAGNTEGGQQRHLPGGEASTGSEHAGALADVFAAAANVLAGHRRGQKGDPVAVGLRFFLHHHRIRPGRHRSAGHDAHAVAGGPLALIGLTGKSLARHDEGGAAGEIRQPHRVTIHGGVVERGHGERGGDIHGEYPAKGLWQGQLFAVAAAIKLCQHALQGVAQGE